MLFSLIIMKNEFKYYSYICKKKKTLNEFGFIYITVNISF